MRDGLKKPSHFIFREIDPLAIIKYDTDLKTNIILGNKIQESINIDETINTNSIDNQLERLVALSYIYDI